MILECPLCHARYMVPAGLFAQGARQVRCARCKHQWIATPPNHIDVVAPSPVAAPEQPANNAAASPTPNLPALIAKKHGKKIIIYAAIATGILALLVGWPILDWQPIMKAFPGLRPYYQSMGLDIPETGEGLLFDNVTSELRYDGGTMKLFVDGVIHNTTADTQFIPDIRATARAPDRSSIQSWWIAAPAVTVTAGGDVPFHTEITAPMQHTIEDVYLEFIARDDKKDAGQ